MGSFDVGCGLSNLAIHEGDKVGLLIIGKTIDYNDLFVCAPQPGKLLKIYATDDFKPFLPPIYGRYDDYGKIRDIEESVTTRLLETIYGKPIQTVLKCLGSIRGIYGNLSDIYPAYVENDLFPRGYNHPVEETLRAVGFIMKTVDNEDIYSFGGYNLTKTGPYWDIRKDGADKVLAGGFGHGDVDDLLDFFGYHTKVYPCFNPEDYGKIHSLNALSGMFFLEDVLAKMIPVIADDFFVVQYTGKFQQDWDLFMEMFTPNADGEVKRFASSWGSRANDFISKNTVILPEQYGLLSVYKNNSEFLGLAQFLDVIRSINRMIEPTICGEQQGNDLASAGLNVITSSILEERRKEYEDEYDYEEGHNEAQTEGY